MDISGHDDGVSLADHGHDHGLYGPGGAMNGEEGGIGSVSIRRKLLGFLDRSCGMMKRIHQLENRDIYLEGVLPDILFKTLFNSFAFFMSWHVEGHRVPIHIFHKALKKGSLILIQLIQLNRHLLSVFSSVHENSCQK